MAMKSADTGSMYGHNRIIDQRRTHANPTAVEANAPPSCAGGLLLTRLYATLDIGDFCRKPPGYSHREMRNDSESAGRISFGRGTQFTPRRGLW